MKKLICILAVLGGAVSASQDVLETELTGPGWKFWNSTNPEIQLPATTPSTFHLDLLANKVVPDPYYRDNLLQFYRFEYENWTYSYPAFTLDDSFYGKQAIEMTFEGLDTHSDIWLNGKLLASTNNTHRTWVFDVTTKLSGKGQPNNLTIYFNSAVAHDLRAEAAMKAKYDISLPANYSYSRKSAYHYGWDWGPRLVTAGIWRPIKVRAYDYLRINSVLFRNDEVTKDTSKKSVRIYGTVSLQTLSKPAPQGQSYFLKIVDASTQTVLFNTPFSVSQQQHLFASRMLQAEESSVANSVPFEFTIKNPQLWWTWNLGTPALYNLRVDISLSDGGSASTLLDTQTTRVGIRTIKWVRDLDPNGLGSSFYLQLNGVPVFMRGSNYIPPDMFMPRALQNNSIVYNQTIQAAIDANHNMLRLWGGGQYEYDVFYDKCDEKGMLIWHDMMFACAMYPAESDMLENIKQETIDNVRRLRNHPSIALWNGNNEVLIGWEYWGWQDKLNQTQKDLVFGWYNAIFEETLPQVIQQHDPDRFYWPTSPTSQVPGNYSFGDIHQWMVWAGAGDIELYNSYIGRFVSEYGMQGMLPMTSIRQFSTEADWDTTSFVMRLHERHIAGWPTLNHYMAKYFQPTRDFNTFAYGTMVMQAYAIETAIQALRRSRPYCMGTLYWQINDVWPVFSWASVDYYGQWKALHYRGRENYKDVVAVLAPLSDPNSGSFRVHAINEKLTDVKTTMVLDVMLFNGTQLGTFTFDQFVIPANSRRSQSVELLLPTPLNANTTYVRVSLWDYSTKSLIHSDNFFYVPPIYRTLPKPVLNITCVDAVKTCHFSTFNFAHYVYLELAESDDTTLRISNNFFDLTSGMPPVEVKILSNHTLGDISSKLQVSTLFDSYN